MRHLPKLSAMSYAKSMTTKNNPMHQLENKLSGLFTKTIPYQLPESARTLIVKYLPWFALVGGIISVFAALGMYKATMDLGAAQQVNELFYPYAYRQALGEIGPMIWAAIGLLLVQSVIFFMAFPVLKTHQRRGWELLYWASLLSAVYSLVYLLARFDTGSFVGSLLGAGISLYILFQIRGYYGGTATSPSHSMHKPGQPPTTHQ